jgi:hypothetical protein
LSREFFASGSTTIACGHAATLIGAALIIGFNI